MSLEDLRWFHGKITRENAEELMKSEATEDGSFLIRECNTASGDFVLALLYQDQVYQYQIRRHGEDAFFSIDDKVKILHGLDTLVEFYRQGPNGLITKLTTHLKKNLPPNNTRRHGHTNLLHRATKENNQTVVSELLKCGYRNVDAKNEDGQTAVHLAALHSDEDILCLLLEAGVNVNCVDTFGYMPLHYACRSRPSAFIRTLIKANANVQGRNHENGYVPLHEAAKYGNLAAVQELLAAHAPLCPRTKYGEFPAVLAEEAGHADVVEFLKNYKIPEPVSTHRSEWYHGTLNREEAVQILEKHAAKMQAKAEEDHDDEGASEGAATPKTVDTSGCFLVRYTNKRSKYVLTMLCNDIIKNFIISESAKYLYIDDGPYLPSLEHLIEHFMRFADGLPVPLRYPVAPSPKPPLPLFSTMPKSTPKKASQPLLISPTGVAENKKLHPDELVRKISLDALSSRASPPKLHSQTLQNPKKKQKESGTAFNTLKILGPAKNFTLRKSKGKSKAGRAKEEAAAKEKEKEQTSRTESVLKEIRFKVDLQEIGGGGLGGLGTSSPQVGDDTPGTASPLPPSVPVPDGFYNVPQNNAAVALPLGVEKKTEAEVEYFTKSDVIIERERFCALIEQQQHQEAQEQSSPLQAPPVYPLNANGYVPTVDLRVFHDSPSPTTPKDILEISAAELRAISYHPERLDSLISTISTESEMIRHLTRQTSNSSCASSTTITQATLQYLIPPECLERVEVIGEGEFASVYKGWLKHQHPDPMGATALPTRREVAIKTLHSERCRSEKQEFLREASVMIRLQHHCIVQFIGISRADTLMMVQELVPLGSMLYFIVNHREKINPNYELKVWASQIACGMEYLESQHFVHRDLAARNILLASRHQAKISDFGLSRALGSDNDCYQASQGGKWPIKWYAPECFKGIFSHASDVWSFGVTLWEMFSLGEPPYGELRGTQVMSLIEEGQRLPQPPLCPGNVYKVMLRCWNKEPSGRPTFHNLTDFFANDPDYPNITELIKTQHIG